MSKADFQDYLVVEFCDDERVAVIASNWLEGTHCAVWPPYTDDLRVRNAAKKREVPGDTWKAFPIKEVFHYETDDWDKATKKCLKLEKMGTVESTDPEDFGRSKRRKRSPTRFGRSRSPSPQTSTSSSSSRCKRTRYVPSDSGEESSDDEPETSPQVLNKSPPAPPPAPPRVLPLQGRNGTPSPRSFSSSRSQTPQRDQRSSSGLSLSASNARIQPERNGMVPIAALEPILNGIFQALEEIKADLRSLKKARRADSKGSSDVLTELPLDVFPITTVEDLFLFEERLQAGDFMSQVVRTLTVYTGRTLKEEIHTVMRNILHNDVVKCFNLSGKGQKQKRAFQVLRLYKVVRTAVFKHYPDAVEQEFRDRISDYLGGAGDRDGGRKSRQEKAHQKD